MSIVYCECNECIHNEDGECSRNYNNIRKASPIDSFGYIAECEDYEEGDSE